MGRRRAASLLKPHRLTSLAPPPPQVLSAAVREAQLPGVGPTSREPTAAVPAGAAYRMDENITVFVEVSGGCERILR